MSVRDNITGPFAEITVGAGSSATVFNLPKELLCNSSTYFKAALNNGFSETLTQKITLDDEDHEVFRTYAVWLLQNEITKESLSGFFNGAIESHLSHVYVFADKRGIRCLANDVVTMMSSYWIIQEIDKLEWLSLIPQRCTLYELTVDTSIAESRDTSWDTYANVFESLPREILLDLFRRERTFPASFTPNSRHCFNSICHYHEHISDRERIDCMCRTEEGRNLLHLGPWEQVEWRW